MSLQVIAAPLMLSSLAACATAMDDIRDGQAVVETTLGAINNDPPAWEGRWVRVYGWVDDKASVLSSTSTDNDGDFIKLNPQTHRRSHDGTDYWTTPNQAVVSGLVDITCWSFWQNAYVEMNQSFKTDQPYTIRAAGKLDYCNRLIGPHLTNVIVSQLSEKSS